MEYMAYIWLAVVTVILYGSSHWMRRVMLRGRGQKVPGQGAFEGPPRGMWTKLLQRILISTSRQSVSSKVAPVATPDDAERVARVLEDLYREWSERAQDLEAAIAVEREAREAELARLRQELSQLAALVKCGDLETAPAETLLPQSQPTAHKGEEVARVATDTADANEGWGVLWDERCLEAVRRLRGGAPVHDVARETGLEVATVAQLASLLEPPPYPAQ